MTNPNPREKSIETAIETALENYQKSHILDEAGIQAVRSDFTSYYEKIASMGLVGIRWHFDGCIICGKKGKLHRLLVLYPELLQLIGRALGTEICDKHIHFAHGYHAEILDAYFAKAHKPIANDGRSYWF